MRQAKAMRLMMTVSMVVRSGGRSRSARFVAEFDVGRRKGEEGYGEPDENEIVHGDWLGPVPA
jgi:hypothetical protein